MNLVMLPMWIFSGVFFSASRFPDALQPFIQALPLTAVNDALRATMLEGRGPERGSAPELAVIVGVAGGELRPGGAAVPLALRESTG